MDPHVPTRANGRRPAPHTSLFPQIQHAKRQARELDVMGFARYMWLEDQLGGLAQDVEALRPQLDAARLTEAVHAARDQHDAGIAEAQAQAVYAVELLNTVAQVWRVLMAQFEHQQDGFFAPRTRQGHQAFDVDGGRADAQRLFAACFPSDPRAQAAFFHVKFCQEGPGLLCSQPRRRLPDL